MAPITPTEEKSQASLARPTPINPPVLTHTPVLRLHLNALTHPATTAFLANINTAHLIPNALNHILRHLYHPHGGDHVPPVRSVTLILRDMGGVAYTTGLDLDQAHKEIHLSLSYLTRFLANPSHLHTESLGVITHELVHCYQHNCHGTAPGGLIEGIADYIRLKAGLAPPHWKKGTTKETRGEKWDEGYQRTAWFLEWLEREQGGESGAVSRINEKMRVTKEYKEHEFWEGLFGKTAKDLWKEYEESWAEDEGAEEKNSEQKATPTCAVASSSEEQHRAKRTLEATAGKSTQDSTDTEPELVDLSLEERAEADTHSGGAAS